MFQAQPVDESHCPVRVCVIAPVCGAGHASACDVGGSAGHDGGAATEQLSEYGPIHVPFEHVKVACPE
jgi:hypothetical protein